MVMSRLLRLALMADGAATAATGLLLLGFTATLAPLFGLPAALMYWAGVAFLPYAALVGYLGTRATAPRGLVWAVIAGNLAWAVDSVLVIVLGWLDPTSLGQAFVLGQATIVFALADLQYLGLRRSSAAREGTRPRTATA